MKLDLQNISEPLASVDRRRSERAGKLDFITAIPLDVRRGSGCLVGIQTLKKGLEDLGCDIALITPKVRLPLSGPNRTLFNECLRFHRFREGALTIGFDADGYTIARRRRAHVACIKGVLGDILPFESRLSRSNLAWQVHLEKLHAQRADLVIVPSAYCAERLADLYGVPGAVVIPELINLDLWRSLLAGVGERRSSRFRVLCVCRFYARKRIDLLLQAAALLRDRLPELEVRIVGGGMERNRLHQLSRELRLQETVTWAGDVTLQQLAAEYCHADVFCLPSVQEGFGIVFLEAMAAGKPIVAARAAAVPEVVKYGYLAEPGEAEDLAAGIERLYSDTELRTWLGEMSRRSVERFDIHRVSGMFLDAISGFSNQ
ncbi:MAG TPA: glycosyltransferase [Acidobacteriaceae bacterium]|nr:glycosyltransferase [Acidobacteriaceae bacterium]